MQAVFVLSYQNLLIKKTISSPSLAWLTDLRTGQPLADQPVNFLSNGQALGSGTTDAEGVAQAQLDINPEQPWVEVLAVAGEPGADGFAVASSAWSQGIGSWEYGIGQGYETDPYRSVFYTERPIYRPGQTVHWKGIVRQLAGEDFVLPAQELPIHITIRDDRGNTVQELDVTPNTHGTVAGQLELAPEATTGYYYLEARILTGTDRYSYGGAGFQVASYRKPEFQISVTPALDEVTQGQMVTVTMQADYFSGGPLANAPVDWRILAEPFTFFWPDAPKGRWFSFETFDPNQNSYDPYAGFFYGLIKEGTGKTDAQGRFDLSVPADLADSLASQRWSFDLTVQSPTNQFVSGNTAVVVHKGDFYIGLSPRSYVISAGSAAEIDAVTLQPDYAPYPDAALQAVVYQFNWNSVFEKGPDGIMRWTTNVERIPVYTDTLTTDAARPRAVDLDAGKGRPISDRPHRPGRAGQCHQRGHLCVGQRPQGHGLCALAPGQQRPHRVGGGQEALRTRRRGQGPGAQPLCQHRERAGHGPGQRRAGGDSGTLGDPTGRQQPDPGIPHHRGEHPQHLHQRGAGEGGGRDQRRARHAGGLCAVERGHRPKGTHPSTSSPRPPKCGLGRRSATRSTWPTPTATRCPTPS